MSPCPPKATAQQVEPPAEGSYDFLTWTSGNCQEGPSSATHARVTGRHYLPLQRSAMTQTGILYPVFLGYNPQSALLSARPVTVRLSTVSVRLES